MLEITVNILTNIIKFVYVYLALHIISGRIKINYKSMCVWTLIYNAGFILLKDVNYTMYILQGLYMFAFLYVLGRKQKIERKIVIPMICTMLFLYEVINMVSNFVGAMLVLFFQDFPIIKQCLMVTLLIILKSLMLYIILIVLRRECERLLKVIQGNYLFCIAYCIAVCFRLPFLYTDIRDGLIFKAVFVAICCCTAVFFIITQIDRHNAAKERAKVEESNRRLAAKLHKSQEILPAMVQVLSEVTEHSGIEMEEQKAHRLLKEVSGLYEQQLVENGQDDLQLKIFNSTGLTMFDQQLIGYQREAVEKNINLDIFVQAPIDVLIRKKGIDQLRLQRAVGDYIRNAFQAVGKVPEKSKHVLVIIGCQQEDILEIAVMDNGVEFPLHVLEVFGKRGVTTGGTGNGLADIKEFAMDMKASIRVDEFDGETDLFTKKISIIFDNKQICYINSPRGDEINSVFWDKK